MSDRIEHYKEGLGHFGQNEFKEAIECYNRALEADPALDTVNLAGAGLDELVVPGGLLQVQSRRPDRHAAQGRRLRRPLQRRRVLRPSRGVQARGQQRLHGLRDDVGDRAVADDFGVRASIALLDLPPRWRPQRGGAGAGCLRSLVFHG